MFTMIGIRLSDLAQLFEFHSLIIDMGACVCVRLNSGTNSDGQQILNPIGNNRKMQ